ncbi:MAG: hypothetical protein WKF71_02850 [Pyrinomonadaceae bacterium]
MTAKNSPTQKACTKAHTFSPKPKTNTGETVRAAIDYHRHRLGSRLGDAGA